MRSLSELKTELADARAKLRSIKPVAWGSGGLGMTSYGDQLTLVTRLQSELNRALKQEEAI